MAAKSRNPRFRKYPVTLYQKKALESLKPPENITVSEWAEKYRVLDSKSSAMPGPWRTMRNELEAELASDESSMLLSDTFVAVFDSR